MFSGQSKVPAIRGGLQLPRQKPAISNGTAITTLSLPGQLIIPLVNYQQRYLEPAVAVGESVTLGSPLAAGIKAPADGLVTDITDWPMVHPSGMQVPSVILQSESPGMQSPETAVLEPRQTLSLARLSECSVTGLGGAGFQTADKLAGADIHTLIINAVECEPLICCDESLILEDSAGLIKAIHSMAGFTGCTRCILAIEADKTGAISALQTAMLTHAPSPAEAEVDIELTAVKPVYPSGAERPLVECLTGLRLPEGSHPVNHGIVCLNIGTVHAAWRAMQGYVLSSRIITVTGSAARHHCNVRVRLGTSIQEVLHQTDNAAQQGICVRAGGPLSGFTINDLCAPVTASTHCISLEPDTEPSVPDPCIRCSQCSDVCPVNLLPQQLYWYARDESLETAQRLGLSSCMECGCCDAVCPSRIPLTQVFRAARSLQRERQWQAQEAELAQMRFNVREQRIKRREQEREQQRRNAKQSLDSSADTIANALARARARRQKQKQSGDH